MKSKLILLFSLIFYPAFSEIIGPVEYHLPSEGWTEYRTFETPNGVTIIYTPDQALPTEEGGEYFGVHFNPTPTDLTISALEESMIKLFPDLELDFSILEIQEHSVTYELFEMMNGEKVMYQLSRIFSSESGTVLLSYIRLMDEAKDLKNSPSWLALLQKAHLIN